MFFVLIIPSLFSLDLVWWIWAHRRARVFENRRRRVIARVVIAAFALFQLSQFVGLMAGRFVHFRWPGPPTLIAYVYLWHLIVMPATTLILIGITSARLLARVAWKKSPVDETQPSPAPQSSRPARGWTRREILGATAIALPPLAAAVTTGIAFEQLGQFRIRRIDLPLANLPAPLDGMTIAQISDVHVGRFTKRGSLRAVADATNQLRADLVLLTGDLIDFSISDLPDGLDMVRRLDSRFGLFMIEGNHDLFQDRVGFERQTIAAGVPLLLNDSLIANVRGFNVQLLGMKWGAAHSPSPMYVEHGIATLALLQKSPDVFPILMGHHPHAFDLAVQAGVPLTLAGHTHGGQLMLTKNIGPGPMLYKYWSGLYRQQNSALVVSNGVGNWFPLRINAPAEIVHLTLRRA